MILANSMSLTACSKCHSTKRCIMALHMGNNHLTDISFHYVPSNHLTQAQVQLEIVRQAIPTLDIRMLQLAVLLTGINHNSAAQQSAVYWFTPLLQGRHADTMQTHRYHALSRCVRCQCTHKQLQWLHRVNLLELCCRLNRSLRRFVPVIPSSDPCLALRRPCGLINVIPQLKRYILCQCLYNRRTQQVRSSAYV